MRKFAEQEIATAEDWLVSAALEPARLSAPLEALYKAPLTLGLLGHTAEARSVLSYLDERYQRNGHFDDRGAGNDRRSDYYRDLWLMVACQLLGDSQLLNEIWTSIRHQAGSSACGVVAREGVARSAPLELRATALAGVAALTIGDLRWAAGASETVALWIESQVADDFELTWNLGFSREPSPPDRYTVLARGQKDPLLYALSLAGAFLALAGAQFGRPEYVTAARRALTLYLSFGPMVYTNKYCGKLAWFLQLLQCATGRNFMREITRCRAHLLSAWSGGPFSLDPALPCDWRVCDNTAETVLWLLVLERDANGPSGGWLGYPPHSTAMSIREQRRGAA